MRKEWWVYAAILAVSIGFLVVSFMVFVYGGKSAKWTSRKMRIGGILLALNSFIAIQSCNRQPEATCYETVATDQMWLEPMNEGITSFSKFDTVKGAINFPESGNFSYRIANSKQKTVDKNIILPQKDTLSSFYLFTIQFPPQIKPGKYTVSLYSGGIEQQDSAHYLKNQYQIIIKNE